MNRFYKSVKLPFLLLLFGVAVYFIGKFLSTDYLFEAGLPLRIGSAYIVATAIALFLNPKTWNAWKKFGYWALPLFIILIALTPYREGILVLGAGDRLDITRLLGMVFLFISLFIIIVSTIRQKRG